MSAPTRFSEFVGNSGIVGVLERALARDRLPHALIFAGPPGVGKRTLATLVARRLNCLAPQGTEPCGQCRSCRKIAAQAHPDVSVVAPDGAFIKIDQVRDLTAEVAFEPFESKYRIAILDPAEAMRNEAANSLLKTLEEPPSRTFLCLITASPYALLPTIQSRCRTLHFGGIAQGAIERYLTGRVGRDAEEARLAAASSGGSLAAALAFDASRHREARRDALGFVALLAERGRFREASRLAAAFGKDKEEFIAWSDAVSALLQEVYYAQISPRRLPEGGSEEVRRIAAALPHPRVVSAIEAMRALRSALEQNVNRPIALEALFLKLVTP